MKYKLVKDNLLNGNKKRRDMAVFTSLGLGKTMEKKLHSVGIHSAEELLAVGSKQAVFGLKRNTRLRVSSSSIT